MLVGFWLLPVSMLQLDVVCNWFVDVFWAEKILAGSRMWFWFVSFRVFWGERVVVVYHGISECGQTG